jgi:hypothetical protein
MKKNKLSVTLFVILLILVISAISYKFYLENKVHSLNILSTNIINDYSNLNLNNNTVEDYHCYQETNEGNKIIIDYQEIYTNDDMILTNIKEEKTTFYLSKKDYLQDLSGDIIESNDNKKMLKTSIKNDYLDNNPNVLISDYINYLGSSYVCGV